MHIGMQNVIAAIASACGSRGCYFKCFVRYGALVFAGDDV